MKMIIIVKMIIHWSVIPIIENRLLPTKYKTEN